MLPSCTTLKRALLATPLLGLPISALADTLHVSGAAGCNDGTGNPYYCHVANAITAAGDGDTIQIAAGTYQEALTITKALELVGAGAGQTFLDGNNAFRPVSISGGAVVQLNSLTVQGGSAAWGGAIFVSDIVDSLSIVDCVLTNNVTTSDSGGAIASWGTLTVEGSRLTGNATSGDGGAIFVGNGATNVVNSLIDHNMAVDGGAVFVSAGTAAVTNSTVSDNVATGQGGALYKQSGSATFTNATVAGNASTSGTVGGIYSHNAIVTLQNTLVAGNTNSTGTQDCGNGFGASLFSLGHNFIGVTTGCTVTAGTGDILDQGLTAADLDDLADNGGRTLTRALLTGSAAIDAGAGCATKDQRGAVRPTDGDGDGTAACDIGAFEAAEDTGGGGGGGGSSDSGGGGGGTSDLFLLLAAGLGVRRRFRHA